MMKKYNTPEIVALALETVDVIATSGSNAGATALQAQLGATVEANITQIEERFSEMQGKWSW